MANKALVECSFYIPLHRDSILSNGEKHKSDVWDWLESELFKRFDGVTSAPGNYRGFYADPDTGQKVSDESRRFIVAVPKSKRGKLKSLLMEACGRFQQKCIYLSIGGNVEFIVRRKK